MNKFEKSFGDYKAQSSNPGSLESVACRNKMLKDNFG